MIIKTEQIDDLQVIRILGDLEVEVGKKLKAELYNLLWRHKYNIIIDLRGVNYIDSLGIGIQESHYSSSSQLVLLRPA